MKIGDSIYDPGELIETNAPMDQGELEGDFMIVKVTIGILSMCIIEPGAPMSLCKSHKFLFPHLHLKT